MTHLDQHQRAPQGGYRLQRKLLAATIAACFGVAQANPTLPQVVAGQATFNQQGNVFSITNTPNTIINWQSFSINRDEITRFIQQSSDSKVLNRITGQDPSQILGSLQSNGQVFLINPNGIMFGKDARIDVNGLVASSLQLSNADFLAGKNSFNAEGSAGKVVNQGQIATPQGGRVFLIAPTVENHGVITAPNGEILLAAGKSVQLVDSSNPAIQVVVSAPEDQALNLGQIVAQGGRVGIYGALVNQRGVVNANSAVRGENGKIMLKASRTVLAEAGSRTTATGAGKGGEIQILGEKVGLNGDALVDASGQQGGGAVLLGGDYQGKNAAVQNAQQTFVGKNAVVKADALASGDGGKVIVWGDESAQAYGTISARSANGKGGFVETSGHYLDVAGLRVDTTGKDVTGVWLLDPYNIEVVASSYGAYGLADVATWSGGLGGDTTSQILASTINGATSNVVLQARHDIDFNAAVNIAAPGVGLNAQAGNHINVNNSIATNGGAVTLSAADTASGSAIATGSVLVNGAITTNGGKVLMKGANITIGNAVNSAAGDIDLLANAGGNINIQSGGSLTAAPASSSPTDPVPTILLRADSMTIDGVISNIANGGGYVSLVEQTSGRDINIGGSDSAGALSLSDAELAHIQAFQLIVGGANSGNVNINSAIGAAEKHLYINSGKDINVNAAVSVNPEHTVDLKTFGAGNIAIGSAGSINAEEVVLKAGGAVSGTGTLTASELYVSGASVNLGGNNSVNKLAGAASAGGFTYKDSGDVLISAGNGLEGINASGDVHLTATSLAQEWNAPVVGNALTLVGTEGNYTLNGAPNSVASLTASGVRSLSYTGISDLTVESVTVPATYTTSASVNIHLHGAGNVLTAKEIDGKGNFVSLMAPTITVASGGVVEGGNVNLVTDQLNLTGTVKGHQFTDYKGNVSLGSSHSVYVGTTLSVVEGTALRVSTDTLGHIDAQSIFVSAGYGMDLTMGTFAAPADTYMGFHTSGVLKVEGAVTAQSGLSLNAADFSFNPTGVSIDGGSHIVNFSSSRSNGLMQVNGSTAGVTNVSSDMLNVVAGEVMVNGVNGVKVEGAVDRGTRGITLASNFGAIDINAPVTGSHVSLVANQMNVNANVNANSVFIAPLTDADSKYSMVIGGDCDSVAAGTCLAFKDLSFINAPRVQLGGNYNTSTIKVAGIGGTGDQASNTAINNLVLASAGDVTQTGAINTKTLELMSQGNVTLNHAGNAITGLRLGSYSGQYANNVDLASTTALNLLDSQVSGLLKLTVGGALTGSALVTADKLQIAANGAVGSTSLALLTKVNTLDVVTNGTTGNSINIVNNSHAFKQALKIDQLVVGSGDGSITLSNYGATTISGPVSTVSGSIHVAARSPLTVSGNVQSGTGHITLEAGASGLTTDKLVISSGATVSTAGTVLLKAGDTITQGGTVTAGGGLTQTPNLNPSSPPPTSPPPTNPPPVDPPPVNPPPVNPPPVNPPPVNPPPVNPPPVNPPPVDPPPVNPPPVNPPPVDPPPVNPPPVNPPPVNPPPVDPPPVNPPPVNPPPTADICTIAPNSALCQVLSPPTANEPEKPVQAATKEVIKTITRESSAPGSSTSSSSSSGGGSSSSGKGSDSSGGPAATDKDEQKKAEKETAATEKQGTQNEKPAAKTYCN